MFLSDTAGTTYNRKDKKLIMVRSDLADELLELASREGKPLSSYVQEHLEHVVKARQMGYAVRDAISLYDILVGLKSAGAMFVPLDVMKFLVEVVPPGQREKLRWKWYEAGQWYGKYLLAKYSDGVESMERLLLASWWDLDEVKTKRGEGWVEFRCISMSFSYEETEFLRYFIEGAMHSLGYKTGNQDCTRGIVFLAFKQDSGPDE